MFAVNVFFFLGPLI
jgi:hypothetical protein